MSLEVGSITRSLRLDDLVKARSTPSDSIEYISEPISYGEFFSRFLLPNKPCVFGPAVTKDWICRQEWVTAEGKPDFDDLKKKFGGATVPVANCNEAKYCTHVKSDMLFGDYIDYWKTYIKEGYPTSMPSSYCKDWHFSRAFPDYQFYMTPKYFESDWLNEYWDTLREGTDDYRFVYMGPKGTWTPFHADVLRSYSWSANICGRKKWIFFPPGEEKYLTDRFGQLAYDVTSAKELGDKWKFPHAADLKQKFEIFQEPGEMVFVPSGWHHQVYNLDDTISINHNWMNGCNIDICWEHVKSYLEKVKTEIDDCRTMMDLDEEDGDEFSDKCQVILKAAAGIDYSEFFNFVYCIACHRMNILQDFKHGRNGQGSNQGRTVDDDDFDELSYCDSCSECEKQLQCCENSDSDFGGENSDLGVENSDLGADTLDSEAEKQAFEILMELENEENGDHSPEKLPDNSVKAGLDTELNSVVTEQNVEDIVQSALTKSCDSQESKSEKVLVSKDCVDAADKKSSCACNHDSVKSEAIVDGQKTLRQPSEINDTVTATSLPSDKHPESCKGLKELQQKGGYSFSRSICQCFGLSDGVNARNCNHFLFDVNRTIDVMDDMVQNDDFRDMDDSSLLADPEEFLSHVKHFVKHYSSV